MCLCKYTGMRYVYMCVYGHTYLITHTRMLTCIRTYMHACIHATIIRIDEFLNEGRGDVIFTTPLRRCDGSLES